MKDNLMEQQLQLLAQKVYNFCGLNYFTNMNSFQLKVARRLQALSLNDVEAYRIYVQAHPEEWKRLIEELTINETYFFREQNQLNTYKDDILPVLKNNHTPIRVWSATCSSGEEPYTLAMLAAEAGVASSQQIEIVATDINLKVLEHAKRGVYNKRSLSFRRIEETWLKKYFEETATSYEVKSSIQDVVSFEYLNLLQQHEIDTVGQFDIIFCRNVLIYFDEETVGKVIAAFYKALKPGGYLFLGHAESITKYKDIGFETINENGTFYYRKG